MRQKPNIFTILLWVALAGCCVGAFLLMPGTLRALAPWREPGAGVAWATKGFEPGSGRFLRDLRRVEPPHDIEAVVLLGPLLGDPDREASRVVEQ